MAITREDLFKIDKEYGVKDDPCPICGGMTDIHLGHLPLERCDGSYTHCSIGDLRVLAAELRRTLPPTIDKDSLSDDLAQYEDKIEYVDSDNDYYDPHDFDDDDYPPSIPMFRSNDQ